MDSTAIAKYTPQKKRVFPGSSSSTPCMDPDVIEIAPPSADEISKMKSKAKGKRKEIASYEIIDVDMDEDRNDVVFIDSKVECNSKKKRSIGISLGPSCASQSNLNTMVNSATTVKSNKKGKEVPVETGQSWAPGSNNLFDIDEYVFDNEYMALQSHFDDLDFPTGVEAPLPWFPDLMKTSSHHLETSHLQVSAGQSQSQPNGVDPFFTSTSLPSSNKVQTRSSKKGVKITRVHPSVMFPESGGIYPTFNPIPGSGTGNEVSPNSTGLSIVGSSDVARVDTDDVVKMYESFKKFDTVVDHSDHLFSKQKSAMKQPPKNWAKRIQEEWRILEKDLPDTIFVRVYESRMDILRAVIIGAEGTPYHDGLFFFDVCFPSSYPNSPPLVKYHSGGLRINPNLYNCGKVCLSLLNTWSGGLKEKWLPGTSTMLQVLVSIQGLILNTKPYFNEPGFAHSNGTPHGEKQSLQYNENTLILSLKTMVYTMNKPPKNFEDLVVGHFRNRVRDILMACKAYTEGVQVGCLVKGGVQDVDEGDNNCSAQFKNGVSSYLKTLIAAFKKIGANEADEFLNLCGKKFTAQAPAAAGAPPPQPITNSFGFYPLQFNSISTYNYH
ncbi:probable ubiquitin-conjugating enzyme E2 26 isoform X2 [Rutidosis leptorrhynchoides]|uniref:probable ubiquitin-conjugating enzyme E2 26 isoform X2 n=1 Tax=Rutidosis leptorrhynchoides TaxID=125765 RepID=UPI003A9943E8